MTYVCSSQIAAPSLLALFSSLQGRVTESSVKNFQLCCASAEDPDQVVLQFGRVGKHKFNMDLRFPLSPMQVGE